MPKKGTRKNSKGKKNGKGRVSITRRVFSPVGHALNATGSSVKAVANTAGNMVRSGLSGVHKVGSIIANHTDKAIANITSGKSGPSKKKK
jgi:hypothetical protein